jgi:hypothetical protein
MTELEKGQLRQVDSATDTALIQAGVISPEEARKRIADDPDTPYLDLDASVMPPAPPAEPDPNAPAPRQGSEGAWITVIEGLKKQGLGPPSLNAEEARPRAA